ncbi:hypothetical protein lerEdw1_000866 [Lerista edwardsae]|nr:hypothetical protein lerEdw1_000866 [Lerista edwardsae]
MGLAESCRLLRLAAGGGRKPVWKEIVLSYEFQKTRIKACLLEELTCVLASGFISPGSGFDAFDDYRVEGLVLKTRTVRLVCYDRQKTLCKSHEECLLLSSNIVNGFVC